mmetsp:Transcript_3647/g.6432  ORF Transcript_3647/g.6432 Transcript_3647/m.6432 type:complete len:94 (+) Transcript_3647:595-876(+)
MAEPKSQHPSCGAPHGTTTRWRPLRKDSTKFTQTVNCTEVPAALGGACPRAASCTKDSSTTSVATAASGPTSTNEFATTACSANKLTAAEAAA